LRDPVLGKDENKEQFSVMAHVQVCYSAAQFAVWS